VVDSGEVVSSAVYNIHKTGPRTALRYACIDLGQFCVLSFNPYKEMSPM
jgi:hypothetical protein